MAGVRCRGPLRFEFGLQVLLSVANHGDVLGRRNRCGLPVVIGECMLAAIGYQTAAVAIGYWHRTFALRTEAFYACLNAFTGYATDSFSLR